MVLLKGKFSKKDWQMCKLQLDLILFIRKMSGYQSFGKVTYGPIQYNKERKIDYIKKNEKSWVLEE